MSDDEIRRWLAGNMTTKSKMMIRPEVDSSDVQAIAWTAFGSLKGASYMLLRVVEPHAARQWLRGLAPASLHDLSVANVNMKWRA